MELKDLVGTRLLSGVDRYNEDIQDIWGSGYESCEVISFRLDDTTYSVAEDPDDGYRSSARELVVTDRPLTNTFPSVEVECRHLTTYCTYSSDILEIIRRDTEEVILRVGTENTEDYYPYFVAEFHAESLGKVAE